MSVDSLVPSLPLGFRDSARRMGGLEQPAPDPAPSSCFPLFRDIEGEFVAAAVVDRGCDTVLTPGGEGDPSMKDEALASAPMLDATIQAADWLELDDDVVEIRVSMKDRVHYIRPIDPEGSMFLYVALDKAKGQYFDTAQMRIRMIELAFGI